ncbi:MAG: helix-turn-helix transcriptional regulator [Spirochaetales bacterium]|uniref:Helix-turn-helix transcriptional regulator n=1 Tax=Candidatus Thalassospirochaeta sargassi TaxID=3119039 RepID=A0AAJ1MP49_9SPIO|nr:helix-turn-helix transcriptional regulator [Spirochaetales bacterium]
MSVYNSMAVNLKKYRENAGLTQEQLAEKAGCSKNHLSVLERGKKFPGGHLIDRLSDALEIKPFVLFLDEKDEAEFIRRKRFVDYVMDSMDKNELNSFKTPENEDSD